MIKRESENQGDAASGWTSVKEEIQKVQRDPFPGVLSGHLDHTQADGLGTKERMAQASPVSTTIAWKQMHAGDS